MSQVGFPLTWKLEKLSSVADVVDPHPSHRAPPKVDDGIPFVGIGDVSTDGSVDFSRARLVSYKILEEHRQRYSLDDSLIGLGRVASVGKVVRLPDASYEYVVSPTLAVVRPFDVDYKFLFYALQSPDFQTQLNSNKQGSGRESVGITRLRVLEIPIPLRREQKKIVEILEEQLSRLDAALASVRAVREKSARFRRSLLHAAFAGAITGHGAKEGAPPTGWKEAVLGDVCKVVSGSTPKTNVSKYWGGEIPWLTPNDLSKNRSKFVLGGERFITQDGFDSCSTQMVPEGAVLFTSRAPIGYVAIAGVSMCTNQGFKSAIPGDEISSEFLYWQLQNLTDDIRSRASGTTFLEISGRGFAATKIVLPSLSEQERIVEILEEQFSRLDASLAIADVIEKKAAALRRSLLHAAFSGNLTKEWREGADV